MELITMKDIILKGIIKENALTPIGEFTYLRTYSRKNNKEKRREKWEETVLRVVNYNLQLEINHMIRIGIKPNIEELKIEALQLFTNIYNTKQFPSGRTLWVGGTEIAEKYPLSNFNCAFTEVNSYKDICEIFYVLLLGTGVGVKSVLGKDSIEPMNQGITLVHSPYKPVEKVSRIDHTIINDLGNGYAKVYIGDSKEGWVEALRLFFEVHTKYTYKHVHTLEINYNSVRPKGEELKRFGGTASGHESIKHMFDNISKVFKEQIDKSIAPMATLDKDGNIYGRLRPIHILDIVNFIGNNVVVGGVRRTAEIFMFAPHDYECLFAKVCLNGIWSEEQRTHMKRICIDAEKIGFKVPISVLAIIDAPLGTMREDMHHRRMSNNSVCFDEKPSKEVMKLFVDLMRYEGEPGLINLQSANRRRPNAKGLNPCAEILLDSKGVCNLTTVNVSSFVIKEKEGYNIDAEKLIDAMKLSVHIGMRMLLPDLELTNWNSTHKRDTLLGCSLTGWKDAMETCDYNERDERGLLYVLRSYVRDEAYSYAKKLRIPAPLLSTTVKPEGTLSIVAGCVSPGIHYSHSEYYIRRIRINKDTALARTVLELGWKIEPEVGFDSLEKAHTWVVEFPVHSGSKTTKDDLTIEKQFDNYFMFQNFYTDHNTSNTMTVKADEWDKLPDIILDSWNDYVGVSFLSHDGGTYPLMPYESITKEEYEKRFSEMKSFDHDVFTKHEANEYEADETEGIEGCTTGACSFR